MCAAPKGNQFAAGSKTSGRPCIYDEAKATLEAAALEEWSQRPDALSLLKFYGERGYGQQRALEMAEKCEVFREAKKLAMARIGGRREHGAIVGDFDSAFIRASHAVYDMEYRNHIKEMKTEALADDARALIVLQDKGRMDIGKPNKPSK